jgi:hypothetical protein
MGSFCVEPQVGRQSDPELGRQTYEDVEAAKARDPAVGKPSYGNYFVTLTGRVASAADAAWVASITSETWS